MSFLSRLFGAKNDPSGGGDVESRLKELEKEAEQARPGYVGSALNRAGDLALKAEQHDRAVVYYGRAIDAFLDDAQRELARGVANKIIRVRPSAIRTLCTITWLDLAARHQASALMHLRDYVTAAADAGQQARAATQIHLMAKMSPDSEFIDAVADSLDALDYPRRAKEVRGWIAMGAPDALDDALALSDACMQAAVRSNDRDQILLVDEPEEGLAVDADGGDADGVEAADADEAEDADGVEAADADGAEEDDGAEAAEAVEAEEDGGVQAPSVDGADIEASGDSEDAEETEEDEVEASGGDEAGVEDPDDIEASDETDSEAAEADEVEAANASEVADDSEDDGDSDDDGAQRKSGGSRKSRKKRKKKKR